MLWWSFPLGSYFICWSTRVWCSLRYSLSPWPFWFWNWRWQVKDGSDCAARRLSANSLQTKSIGAFGAELISPSEQLLGTTRQPVVVSNSHYWRHLKSNVRLHHVWNLCRQKSTTSPFNHRYRPLVPIKKRAGLRHFYIFRPMWL